MLSFPQNILETQEDVAITSNSVLFIARAIHPLSNYGVIMLCTDPHFSLATMIFVGKQL